MADPKTTTLSAEESKNNSARSQIKQLLTDNWVGPKRSLLASLNEFRHWSPEQVIELFNLLPSIQNKDRKLYPLGPEHQKIPTGSRRWLELGGKVAFLAAVDAIAVPFSPLLMLKPKEERGKAVREIGRVNTDILLSSFFVKLPLDEMEKAAEKGMALCVNKWGQHKMMTSGYAAISHVWAETMGLEFNNEKTEQDERGFNMGHFNRIMREACRTGYEWFWFDLLSIPKNESEITKRVKLLVINSLRAVYKNADTVIILDSLALQLNSGNPLDAAAALCCGLWLTRVWTYQEAKLARTAKVVTATDVIDFENMVNALKEAETRDSDGYNRWHELRLTFDRLLPHEEVGISLADIAMSCDHRQTGNEIDYARAFFALLGLTWQKDWTYEDGMLEIIRSQPRHATRIAGMHGPRGLLAPYTWAPKYLVQLQGKVRGGLKLREGGLVGDWYTVTVTKVINKFVSQSTEGIVCDLLVQNARNEEIQIQISLFPKMRTQDLEDWMEEAVPRGSARLLCGDDMIKVPYCHTALLAESHGQYPGAGESDLGMLGYVAGSAVINDGSVEATNTRWLLN